MPTADQALRALYSSNKTDASAFISEANHIIERVTAERDSERAARQRCEAALRQKDEAMNVLFERLAAAGVDCSDLIP